ncbi:MAG: NB-ARC domain-containing protein, partial [Cyanobacteria bacterium P01_A01_bin.135]
SYQEIARESGYELGYIKQTGSQLWKLLSRSLNQRVTKHNLKLALLSVSSRPEVYRARPSIAIATAPSRRVAGTLKAAGAEVAVAPIAPPEAAVEGVADDSASWGDSGAEGFGGAVRPELAGGRDNPGTSIVAATQLKVDWGNAVEPPSLLGRQTELAQLSSEIQAGCRLIGLFGMGGIGKTSLAAALAHQVVDGQSGSPARRQPFRYVVWRSLRNAPLLSDLLTDILQVLSDGQPCPAGLDAQLRHLLTRLRQHRCLIVLDNGETVMQPGAEYDRYRDLWRLLGEADHQSTVVLTSREKPPQIALSEGPTLPVRSHHLRGLTAEDGQALCAGKGDFQGSAEQWQTLVDYYAGNPLALKIVASVIHDLFDGAIAAFLDCLEDGSAVFGDLRDLLLQQFSRLAPLEQLILYWLAIARVPVALPELRRWLIPQVPLGQLLEALTSLERRYLIEAAPSLDKSPLERSRVSFTLQPAVMECLTQQLVASAVTAILSPGELPQTVLHSLSLLQAQAKDYLRETQRRLILGPATKKLLSRLSQTELEARCRQHLIQARRERPQGYLAGNLLNLLHHIGTDLTGWNFSDLAVWSADLRDAALHAVDFSGADLCHSAFREPVSQVLSVAFSPDGSLLATGDVNHDIRLWRLPEGLPLLSCQVDEGWVWSVAFSPDGKWLASATNRAVKLWEVATGSCVCTLEGYSDRVFSVAFSPDGNWLASGGEDRLIRVWQVKTGQLRHVLSGHTDEVRAVAFNPDQFSGLQIASISYDGTVRLWDAAEGSCLRVLKGHRDWGCDLAYSPDGQSLISGGSDGVLRLWHLQSGECTASFMYPQQIRAVAFSPDGQSVAASGDDGTIWVWRRSQACHQVMAGHSSWVAAIAFSPDGGSLASGGEDQSIKLWDSQTGRCLKTLQGHGDGVWSVAFSADGLRLASGSQDRVVRLWDADGLLKQLRGHSSWIWSVAFHPDQCHLLSASEDQTLRLWDIASGQCLRVLEGHTDAVMAGLTGREGDRLISVSLDRTMRVWDRDGRCLRVVTGHEGGIWCAAMGQAGDLVATGSQDQTVKLWDWRQGRLLQTFTHQSWIRSVMFTADDQFLISGSADGVVKRWEVGTGRCLQTQSAHGGPILSLACSPRGQIASSGTDTRVTLWDGQLQRIQGQLIGHQRWVRAIAFSPDGAQLASCSQDETIKLWALPGSSGGTMVQGAEPQTFRVPRPYEAMVIPNATGLTAAQRAALRLLGALDC